LKIDQTFAAKRIPDAVVGYSAADWPHMDQGCVNSTGRESDLGLGSMRQTTFTGEELRRQYKTTATAISESDY
jgi:hypothetical protein